MANPKGRMRMIAGAEWQGRPGPLTNRSGEQSDRCQVHEIEAEVGMAEPPYSFQKKMGKRSKCFESRA